MAIFTIKVAISAVSTDIYDHVPAWINPFQFDAGSNALLVMLLAPLP